nr:lipocalin family protein [uncultured Desulfobacter sp.]
MKKSSMLFAACLVVCGLLLAQPAFAALYSGPWTSTSGSIITIEDEIGEFGFYDYNDEGSYYALTNGLNTFSITENQVTIFSGEDLTTTTLAFSLNGDTVEFGFYMKEDNGASVTIFKEAELTVNSAGMYVLDFGGESTLELLGALPTELSPVVSETPIPTAALLLGSGLIGLVGFRRKTVQD